MNERLSRLSRYRTMIGLCVMIFSAGTTLGDTSWLVPVLGISLGALILLLPRAE